eukprot:TRINITY_DN2158_c0_g2_i3.p1 TRINITY_DN2158_c0_g2~~TRINITY_DN2158_c0_g2_i3.p1  ORF type:complete len:1301 (+),score=247.94 TRINITY_DN2158_c0_g2_i3:250-4152(+)
MIETVDADSLSVSPKVSSATANPPNKADITVSINTPLMQSLIRRDRSEMIAQSGPGIDASLTSLSQDLRTLENNFGQIVPATENTQSRPAQAAKHQYRVSICGGHWLSPPAIIKLKSQNSVSSSTAVVSVQCENGTVDETTKMAVKTAASKVIGFIRYGTISDDDVEKLTAEIVLLFPDTRVFHKSEGGVHHFVACGLGCEVAYHWLSGTVLFTPTCESHVFSQKAGLKELQQTISESTGCALVPVGDRVGIVGPASKRADAMRLLNGHSHTRECIFRTPLSYGTFFDSLKEELQQRIGNGCKVTVEGGGRIRIMGRPEQIQLARDIISHLTKYATHKVQEDRIKSLTRQLTSSVSRVEVRIAISPQVVEVLSKSGFETRKNAQVNTGEGLVLLKRNADDTQRRITMIWAAVDNMTEDLIKHLVEAKVIPTRDDFDIGVAPLLLSVGDKISHDPALWSAAPPKDSLRSGKILQELVAGKNSLLSPGQQPAVVEAPIVKIEPGVQIGAHAFYQVVSDWIKCTLDSTKPDPGRPVCDVITVTHATPNGKTQKVSITCPGTKTVTIDKIADPEGEVPEQVTHAKEVIRLFYLYSVDELLLAELDRVLEKAISQPASSGSSAYKSQLAILERSRQRCREIAREAAFECDSLMRRMKDKKLIQHLETVQSEWSRSTTMAEWEIEAKITRVRIAFEEEYQAEKYERSLWEKLLSIAGSMEVFVDYTPNSNHILVSGMEDAVRAAVARIRGLVGADIAENPFEVITKTIPLQPSAAAALSANSNFLVSFVLESCSLKSSVLSNDSSNPTLTLSGYPQNVADAMESLSLTPNKKRTDDDSPKCAACLMSDFDEDSKLITLLCGHQVHSSCVMLNMLSKHSLDAEEGCSSKSPCKCPAAASETGCQYVLTLKEYSAVRDMYKGDLSLIPTAIENSSNQVSSLLRVNEKVRTCPNQECNKIVVAGSTAEPLTCLHCSKEFCGQRNATCGGEPHYFSTCEQLRKAKLERTGSKQVKEEVLPSNIVMCSRCPAWIVREDDIGDDRCRYMRCRQCSYEFCWLCLIPSIDHRHVDPQNISSTVSCDPSNREQRRSRLMKAHEVPVWRGYVWCERCDTPYTKETSNNFEKKLYSCNQCLNQYLCSTCHGKGCLKDQSHLILEVPTEDAPERQGDSTCPGGHVLRQQGQGSSLQTSLRCNNCNKTGDPSTYIGCRLCDYDLCKSCIKQSDTRSGGKVSGDSNLSDLKVSASFWETMSSKYGISNYIESPVDSSIDEQPDSENDKKQLMNFISGSIMQQTRSIRTGGGLLAAMLGLQ